MFIIPISKNIFDITGIEVIATPIIKTMPYAMELSNLPIKYSLNTGINGIENNIGKTVAPVKMQAITFIFFLSISSFVL